MRRVALVALCLAALAAPAAAVPQSDDGTLPDGNSAVDQYVDPLPDSDGDRPLGHTPAGGGTKPAPGAISDGPLPLKTQKSLAKRGPDGFRVAGIVRDTSPPEAAHATGAV